MKRLRAIMTKELRQAFRDPLSLGLLLGVPTMMLLLYGYVVNFDVRHVRLAVQNLDRTTASRALVAAFVNSTYFDRVAVLPAGVDPQLVTERRVAKAVLVIPEGFSRELSAGRSSQVQLIIDGTDALSATQILGYATALTAQANAALRVQRTGVTSHDEARGLQYDPRVWYNPELRSTEFLVPGLIGMILMLTAVLSTALSIVREKERGTMEQIRVAPLRTPELILGKTIPYLGMSLIATVFVLVAARLLFGVVIRGPVFDLFLATLVYLLGGLGLGLFVSTIAETQAQAFQFGATMSLLPAILLSGFIFPIRNMPEALRIITYLVPARYYLVVLRGVILKGAGLAPYAREMSFLCAYAVVFLGVAAVRLNRRRV